MLIKGSVGLISNAGDSSEQTVRLTSRGSVYASLLGGKYEEDVKAGIVFGVANQAAVALTAALATTYTGLVVGNPTDSSHDLVMLACSYATTVATPTATALGLMTGTGASVASSLTARNRFVGKTGVDTSAAWCEDSCTLPGTPVLEEAFATAWTEATTAGTLSQPNVIDLDGAYRLAPGAFIAFYSAAANTAAFLLSFLWKQVPNA